MTNNNRDLSIPTADGAVDQPELRTDLDPIAIVTGGVGDDPSVAELVAFRMSAPDLKLAARQSKLLHDEAQRVQFFSKLDAAERVAGGLMLISHCFTALVTIWPVDTLAEAEAKLALAKADRIPQYMETDYVPGVTPEEARRLRIRRAAFNVGELMAPVPPAAPGSADRGLADWPLSALDLTSILPLRGGPPVFAAAQAERWAGLLTIGPDLSRLADRVEKMLKIADRLFALAPKIDNPVELRRAAEGAQIIAYLSAAQVALWPVTKGSEGVKAKRRVAKLIDDRASRPDPLHMQAAVRLMFDEADWIALVTDRDRLAKGTPSWTEIV